MKKLYPLFILCLIIFINQPLQAQLTNWQHKQAITIEERSGNDLTDYQVLLHINTQALINAGEMDSDANDMRFSNDCDGNNILPHFIEKDTNSTNALVWVLMNLDSGNTETIYMFYGNPAASGTSDFETVFPNRFVLETGIELVQAGTAEVNYDWFEIQAGTIYTLSPLHEGKLTINARRIIIDGQLIGDSLGYKGQVLADGDGPGGGKAGDNGGGGGYGGRGGNGEDVTGDIGLGGPAYGNESTISIDAGSAGGASDVLWNPYPGGNGGAGFWLNGAYTTVNGEISCDGGMASFNSQNYVAGPGSGGGILITSDIIDFTGEATAEGAHATIDLAGIYWSSGGAGGGRIKMFYESDFNNTGNMSVREGFTLSGAAESGTVGTIFTTGDSALSFPVATGFHVVDAANATLEAVNGTAEFCPDDSLEVRITSGFNGYDFYVNGTFVKSTLVNQTFISGLTDKDTIHAVVSNFGCPVTTNEIIVHTYFTTTADFSASGNNLNWNFTSNANNADTYLWDFGDGNTSTAINPSHLYSTPGNYLVCFKASNSITGCAADSVCQTIVVSCNDPQSQFTVNANGLTVDLSSQSTNAETLQWLVDQQTVSNDSIYTHIFSAEGVYEICLISENACAVDTLCEEITVCPLPVANFSFQQLGNTVSFTDSSTNAVSYFWDFGNGSTSNSATPDSVTYPEGTAQYEVCLTVTNNCNESNQFCDIITLSDPNAIEELNSIQVQVYPNPVIHSLTISTDASAFVIYTTNGRKVMEGEVHTRNIELNDLPKGFYLIELTLDDGSLARTRFIKE